MDKDATKRVVSHLVTTPKWETVTYSADDINTLAERLWLPCVVKPVAAGSSIGVSIANTREELKQALTA